MDNLQILKLSDNFDVWRDLINKAITHVNDLYEVPSIPDKDTSWQIIATNLDPKTNEYILQWRDIRDFLNKLGMMTNPTPDGGIDNAVGIQYPNGVTVGNYIKLYPTGDIENSGTITTKNVISTEKIISNSTISGNKLSSSSSIECKNIELLSEKPYINFYYNNAAKYTSQIKENESGVLTINENKLSSNGSSIRSELKLFTENNSIIFRNDDINFSILTSVKEIDESGKEIDKLTELRPFTMNVGTGEITMTHGINTSKLHCFDDVVFDKSLNICGEILLYNKISDKLYKKDAIVDFNGIDSFINGDLTLNGTLYTKSLKVDNMNLDTNSLLINPNIHTGANSSLVSNVYIKAEKNSESTKSLVLRNDGVNAHILVADTEDDIKIGAFNSLRPFSLSLTNGDVTMTHNVTVIGDLITNSVTMNEALTVNSDIDATGYIKGYRVYNAVFNDYAEFFERGEETEVGDIISLDMNSNEERYIKATNPKLVVGVHSDTYGHILGGSESIEESEKTHIPVGLTGRVKTKIIGSINKGDEVVLSTIPGVGRKFNSDTDRDRDIIGFVVEDNLLEDIKLVKMKLK